MTIQPCAPPSIASLWGLPLPILTVFITIGTFTLGILINVIIAALSRWVVRSKHRAITRLNQRMLLREVRRQCNYFVESQEKTIAVGNRGFSLRTVNLSSIEVIKELKYENVYKAYLTGFVLSRKKRGNAIALQTFWKSINNSQEVLKDITESFKYKVLEIIKMQEKAALHWQAIQDLFMNLQINICIPQAETTTVLKEFHDAWLNSFLKLINIPDYNNQHNIKIHLMELKLIVNSYFAPLAKFEPIVKFIEIKSNIALISVLYADIENWKQGLKRDLINCEMEFEELYKVIKNTYRQFNSSPLSLSAVRKFQTKKVI